eukprot:GILJ01012674.1.p1 GENE.GILJ01012674.1~~GILJ01012674.1.p1  ORF type:complete len:356 (-),score=38.34 GILJ01012674.1:348-1415(-)
MTAPALVSSTSSLPRFLPHEVEYVETATGKVHYLVFGPRNAASTAILLHDLGKSSFYLQNLAKSLALKFDIRIFVPDFVGCGYSPYDPTLRYDASCYVQQVEKFVGALDLNNSQFGLAGHGMGGLVAIHYAKIHPQSVSWLMLFSPAGLCKPKGLLTRLSCLPCCDDCVEKTYNRLIFDSHVSRDEVLFGRDSYNSELVGVLRKQRSWNVRNVSFLQVIAETRKNFSFTHNDKLLREVGGHPRPVFLMTGAHDTVCSPNSMPRWQRLFPSVHAAIVSSSAHGYLLEHPQQVYEEIHQFLSTQCMLPCAPVLSERNKYAVSIEALTRSRSKLNGWDAERRIGDLSTLAAARSAAQP